MPQRTLPGVINVPGVGPVNFPTTMSDDEVTAACAKLHADNQGIGDKLIGDEQANTDPRAAFGRNALNDAGNVASNLWGAAKGVGGFVGELMGPPSAESNADLIQQVKNAATGLAGVPGHILNTLKHPITNFQQRPISTMLDASVVADPLAGIARGAGRVADYMGAGLTRSAVGGELTDAGLGALRDTRAVPGTAAAPGRVAAALDPLEQGANHALATGKPHIFSPTGSGLRNLNRLIADERTGTAAGGERLAAGEGRLNDFVNDPNISAEVKTPPLTDTEIGDFIRTRGRIPEEAEINPPAGRQMLPVPQTTIRQTMDNLAAKAGPSPAGAAAGANAADLRTLLDRINPDATSLMDQAAPLQEAQAALQTPRVARGQEFGAGARDVADSGVGLGLLFHMLHPAQAMGYMGLRAAAKAPALKGALGQGLYDASQALARPGPNLGVVQGADILHDAMQDNGTKDVTDLMTDLDNWWSPRPQRP